MQPAGETGSVTFTRADAPPGAPGSVLNRAEVRPSGDSQLLPGQLAASPRRMDDEAASQTAGCRERPPSRSPSMIEIRDLAKRYGDTVAVDGLTFDVKPGWVTGFLGPNGAGKSTTMRLILGLDAPSRGTAKVNGRRLPRHPPPSVRGRCTAGGARDPPRPSRPRPPAGARAGQRNPPRPGRRRARDGGARFGRSQARRGLLAGHEPATGHRRRAARRSRGPAARRAGQRPGSRGHHLDPHPPSGPGGRGPHGLVVEPPHERDVDDGAPPDRDRTGPPHRRHQRRRVHPAQLRQLRAGAVPASPTGSAHCWPRTRTASRTPTTARCSWAASIARPWPTPRSRRASGSTSSPPRRPPSRRPTSSSPKTASSTDPTRRPVPAATPLQPLRVA